MEFNSGFKGLNDEIIANESIYNLFYTHKITSNMYNTLQKR